MFGKAQRGLRAPAETKTCIKKQHNRIMVSFKFLGKEHLQGNLVMFAFLLVILWKWKAEDGTLH